MAQANAEAESITVKARVDATTVIDNARAMADKLLDEARLEARRSAENERIKAENEVQALLARRDFLLSDVDHLEHHVEAQRERLRDAAVSLQELIERVPGGLGELRRPLLSASAESVPSGQSVDSATISEVSDFANASGESPSSTIDDPTSLLDATPPEMAAAASDDLDETSIMSLDLELDRQPATTPKWSASGDDPLIIGDELQ